MQIPVDINIDFLWGDKHFVKNEWGDITYIVGANGTGKSIFAEKLRKIFTSSQLKVRYFGADRIVNLASKWDNTGNLAIDSNRNGLNIGKFGAYKSSATELGQSIDALIELQNNLDLQIMVGSILSDIFQKEIRFEERGGYLNIGIIDSKTGKSYDFKKCESHGLKELVTLLTFIYSREYNCIILDEPELNLHPQFQQFILQEIKKEAGSTDDGKKMFVILTHSPYMLDISNTSDLLNYIVFHSNAVPSFINEYPFDDYQMDSLNRLLLRINNNHKTLFFASTPIFVEGYIDQQFFNLIVYIHGIPIGAEGISIIDVGGKDEVDLMYSLCQLLGITGKAILDLDALLKGRIRQTIAKLPETNRYLSQKGQRDVMSTIGELEKVVGEIADSLASFVPTSVEQYSQEFLDYIDTLNHTTGSDKHAFESRRKITFLAIQRIPDELSTCLDEDNKNKIIRAQTLSKYLIESFEIADVFILPKGEIENYYSTYTGNQYSIADNSKAGSFLNEYESIKTIDRDRLVCQYTEILTLLDKICVVTKIDRKNILSLKLGDWIHSIQTIFRIEPTIDMEKIKKHPKSEWNKFEKIIDLVDFSPSREDNTFTCTFKIRPHLGTDCEESYSFDQDTVPSKFSV